jgi:hypothetical protein
MMDKQSIVLRQKARQNFDTRIRVSNLIARNDAVLKRDYVFID